MMVQVVITAQIDGIGEFVSLPKLFSLDELKALEENLKSRKLEALWLTLPNQRALSIPRLWLDRALIMLSVSEAQVTEPKV